MADAALCPQWSPLQGPHPGTHVQRGSLLYRCCMWGPRNSDAKFTGHPCNCSKQIPIALHPVEEVALVLETLPSVFIRWHCSCFLPL